MRLLGMLGVVMVVMLVVLACEGGGGQICRADPDCGACEVCSNGACVPSGVQGCDAGVPDGGDGGQTGCVPKTCAELGVPCGPADDGCGVTLACDLCPRPQVCGGAPNNPRLCHVPLGAWTQAGSPAALSLYAVQGSGPNDVWVAGQDGGYHWNGAGWSAFPTPDWMRLTGVWTSGSGVARAVGVRADGGSASVISTGGAPWSEAPPPSELGALGGVWGSAAQDVWAVGAGKQVLHSTGGAWAAFPSPVDGLNTVTLTAITGTARDNVWAVGRVGLLGPYSLVMRFDGSSWISFPVPSSIDPGKPTGVWTGGANASWFVGNSLAYGYALSWDGATWSMKAVTPSFLRGVWGAAPDDVWMVGDNGLLGHWDGNTLALVPALASSSLYAIWGTASNDIWAVGSEGVLLRYHGP